ncbi:MAG: 50S ribosomal protein L10 [Leptonema sp. (in: bacteria)]
MPSAKNIELLNEIQQYLNDKPNFIVTTYSGLSVEEITQLRKKLRQKSVIFKVVKNNLVKIALKNSKHHQFDSSKQTENLFVGPVAITFVGEEMPSVAKLLFGESQQNEKIKIKGGYYEGKFLDENQMKAISNLPTKEELLVMIARGLNTPAQKIAIGIKEILTKLARGIQEVAEKNNQ